MKKDIFLQSSKKSIRGFTLIELVITVAIFAFMTTFLISKYGTMNQSILLTNLAYDVALTIRNAQSYGINVKSAPTADANYSENFNRSYGVNFSSLNTGDPSLRTVFTFFQELNPNGVYDGSSERISQYTIKRGSIVSKVCVGNSPSTCEVVSQTLNITFQRPNPDAIITSGSNGVLYPYAEIWLQATDGSVKKVVVRSTGQITITN